MEKKKTAKQENKKQIKYQIVTVILWLLLWQTAAEKINQELFLPTPAAVWTALLKLGHSVEFYQSIVTSIGSIIKGFCLDCLVGSSLAVLAAKCPFLKVFFGFPIRIMQAIPVASFTILALFWLDSSELSILVSFFAVLPLIYTNILTGIEHTDQNLLEMAEVFQLRWYHRIRYIYLPALFPYVLSACSVAAGLAWKSAIAAEVIGIVGHTIGNHLYQAKIYMDMPELFAWTIVIIFISILFEYALNVILRFGEKKLTGAATSKKDRIPLEQQKNVTLSNHVMFSASEPNDFLLFSKKRGKEIVLTDVSKRFGTQKICEKFSMQLQPGESVALMGTSGSGKTTIARMILSLEQADSGKIWTTPGTIAAVFQEDRLCESTTVYQNLALVCRTKKQRENIEPILTMLGLGGLGDRKAAYLSGGMKRRVSIARAILADTPAIILDEPLKGLDEATKAMVMQFMKTQLQGKTVIYITHDKTEAVYFGCKIIILEKKP